MNHNPSYRFVACLVLSVAVVCGPGPVNAQAPSGESVSPATGTVMTYNLKFASTKPLNAWSTRWPREHEVIRQIAPAGVGDHPHVSWRNRPSENMPLMN